MALDNSDNKQARKRNRKNRELPPIGTKLYGKFRGKSIEAILVESKTKPQGRALLIDNHEFLSLSGAAKFVTGNSTNGWVFWKLEK